MALRMMRIWYVLSEFVELRRANGTYGRARVRGCCECMLRVAGRRFECAKAGAEGDVEEGGWWKGEKTVVGLCKEGTEVGVA
jgi:hypothetical protein